MAARRDSRRPRRTSKGRDEAEQQTRTTGEDRQDDRAEEQDAAGRDDSRGGILTELKDVASDAALAVLAPVAKRAATQAAKFAVRKGPELMEDKILPKLADAGGPGGLVEGLKDAGSPVAGLLSKVTGGDDDDGGDAGDGPGKARRMPIQQAVDVAAPIDIV